jgi:hypothetical protein
VSAFPTKAPGSHFRREIGEQPEALRRLLASRDEISSAPLPILAPLLSILPGQLFAAALARAKGLDSDKPVGLEKVTLVA